MGIIQNATEAPSPPPDRIANGSAMATSDNPRPALGGMSRFRLSDDFDDAAVGPRIRSAIPIRKPSNQEFFRASRTLRVRVRLFVKANEGAREDRPHYLVEPACSGAFPGVTKAFDLVGCVSTTSGAFFLCPIGRPGLDGEWNPWNRSLAEAVEHATDTAIRIQSHKPTNSYDRLAAKAEQPIAQWPTESMDSLIEIAFRDRIIDGPEHPIWKALEGR